MYTISDILKQYLQSLTTDFAVASYLYSPEHDNWIPFSGSVVKADEAQRMMVRIAQKVRETAKRGI